MKKNNTRRFLPLIMFSPLFILLSCNDGPGCAKIKNGKFYYYTKRTREKIDIERSDSVQLETDAKTGGSPLKSKIVWTSDCKYDMFINAVNASELSGDDSIFAATPSHVDIIYIGATFYVCIAKMNVFNKDLEFRDTIYFAR